MKLQNELGKLQVQLTAPKPEQNSRYAEEQEQPFKYGGASSQSEPLASSPFSALFSLETVDINHISPHDFTSLIADISKLHNETGEGDKHAIEGLGYFRITLEVQMTTGQLDPNAKIDMQQYATEHAKSAESLAKIDSQTYGHSPIYANQSKQAIATFFTPTQLENLQLSAIELLKHKGNRLLDKKV
ncbi:hypothetical protein [Pseudoalteromonas piscicida]|uniref:hypothetical protein n=1 Tax=Pseudoalteromonas piscicida TaxID=43662 RepID=UPI0030A6B3C4